MKLKQPVRKDFQNVAGKSLLVRKFSYEVKWQGMAVVDSAAVNGPEKESGGGA